ncbi:MAG TPA: carotenoid oxygenase family protein [Solirubrobacterales bacterium]|nr:carotenoid oxygenase family protein [Solirubrobacterales bacterium]
MERTTAESGVEAPTEDRVPDSGYLKGFESLGLEHEVRVDELPLTGSLPDWLTGSLIRTGPARFEAGERSFNHWFDGQAMLHRFGFGEGSVSYASRFLRTKAFDATEKGEISYSEFATDPCRSLFGRAMALFSPKLSDNANVNLVQLGERFIAMTETPIPVEFDAETLATAGVAYDVPGMLTTAHPHLDRASGGMLNYAAKLGPRNQYRFFLLEPGAEQPRVIASLPVDQPAYMHSFGLTERYLVLAEFPFTVNPMRLASGRRPYIENYRWLPERGTRITLIDRESGDQSGPFVTDPFFSFHHVNAFDDPDNGEIVVDMCVYEDASVIDSLYLDRLRSSGGVPPAELRRVRIRPAEQSIEWETLVDDDFELPRINYGRCHERPYRYVWGIGAGASGWLERIVRADLEQRTTTGWSEPGCYPGEAVFVATPDGDSEDDGVLLSVVLDSRSERSFLLVLDAADLSELARAEAPHHIPFSFHGQYARSM